MAMTDEEATSILLQGLPPGVEDAWDFKAGPLISRLMHGAGRAHRLTCLEFIEQLRTETNPLTMVLDVDRWEAAFGLSQTWAAQQGTPQQRQAQVLSAWRRSAVATFNNIRAIVQPYFNYTDPSQIQIVETDRDQLTRAHTYPMTTTPTGIPVAISPNSVSVTVLDGPACSDAGAQVFLNLDGHLGEIEFTLWGPAGPPNQTVHFRAGYFGSGVVSGFDLRLDVPEFAWQPIGGLWQLFFLSHGPDAGTLNSASLFVEGEGRNADDSEGLGAAIFEWAVVFDPALVAPGAAADLKGALAALRAIAPAHTLVNLVLKGGGLFGAAIPDTSSAIPDEGIPGV
jgi:hypothetical protein